MEEFLNLMVPEPSKMPIPVSTLVFLDLETTGLPYDVGRKNVHITELSLVAIDRTDFQNDKSLRVINKLSLCLRPRAAISFGATNITGLYNDMLENQKEFDESVPKLFEIFFHRLRPPICLLAHNGKRFDFPILQAELKRLNYSLDREILCADTLETFKNIDLGPPFLMEDVEPEALMIEDKFKQCVMCDQSIQTELHSMSDEEIERLLSLDIEQFGNVEDPNNSKKISESMPLKMMKFEETFAVPFRNSSFPNQSFNWLVNECTPVKILNGSTANNEQLKHNYKDTFVPKNDHKSPVSYGPKPFFTAKRKLFFSDKMPKKPNDIVGNFDNKGRKMQFSLEKLYFHFFGVRPPDGHHAESDCINLSKICQKVNETFLEWIDENCVAFTDIVAMW